VQLLRIVILESNSGVCLVDRAWSWDDESTKPESLCMLIKTFYQMSRDLADGGKQFILKFC
jgi:hypothetical protein